MVETFERMTRDRRCERKTWSITKMIDEDIFSRKKNPLHTSKPHRTIQTNGLGDRFVGLELDCDEPINLCQICKITMLELVKLLPFLLYARAFWTKVKECFGCRLFVRLALFTWNPNYIRQSYYWLFVVVVVDVASVAAYDPFTQTLLVLWRCESAFINWPIYTHIYDGRETAKKTVHISWFNYKITFTIVIWCGKLGCC